MAVGASGMGNFGDHQLGIYLQGMLQGTRPEITTDLARLESQAAGKLSVEAMGYIVPSARQRRDRAGEPGRVRPLAAGTADAPGQHRAGPVLHDPRYADAAPVLVAPIGVQTLAHPDGELATARAADALGLTYTHRPRRATRSSRSRRAASGTSCTGRPIATSA